MELLKILLLGWVILVAAILINFAAGKLGISGWYDFLGEVGKAGVSKAVVKSSATSLIFLFIVYPLFLGAVGYLFLRILK